MIQLEHVCTAKQWVLRSSNPYSVHRGVLQPGPVAAYPCYWSTPGADLPVWFSKKAAYLGPVKPSPNLEQSPVHVDKRICFQKSLNPNIPSKTLDRSQTAVWMQKVIRDHLKWAECMSLLVWHFGADSTLIKLVTDVSRGTTSISLLITEMPVGHNWHWVLPQPPLQEWRDASSKGANSLVI